MFSLPIVHTPHASDVHRITVLEVAIINNLLHILHIEKLLYCNVKLFVFVV